MPKKSLFENKKYLKARYDELAELYRKTIVDGIACEEYDETHVYIIRLRIEDLDKWLAKLGEK